MDENIAYHASRILLLIKFSGKPQKSSKGQLPGIVGRTLLAKLDFFLRYPKYLYESAKRENFEVSFTDLGVKDEDELNTVETRMIRFLYGPWDHKYYSILAYLIGKGLIIVERDTRKTEIFRLTTKGEELLSSFSDDQNFKNTINRVTTIQKLFGKYKGNQLKEYIYKNFPEVVNRDIGAKI